MTVEKASKKSPVRPGALIASYRYRPLSWNETLGLVLLIGLAVSAPLLYGYYRAQYAIAYYGPVAVQLWSRPWYLLTGFAIVVSLALILVRLIEGRRRVEIHANGLLVALSGKRFIPWKILSGVASGAFQTTFLGLPLSTRFQATLYPAIGRPVKLDDRLENLPELLTQVKARLYPQLLTNSMKAFSEGQRLYYGNISIDPTELRLADGLPSPQGINWESIRSIQIQSGWLLIETESDETIKMPVTEIPNLEVLLQIIHRGVNR